MSGGIETVGFVLSDINNYMESLVFNNMDDEALKNNVTVRLTDFDYKRLAKLCSGKGFTKTDFLRALIIKTMDRLDDNGLFACPCQ